MGIQNFSIQLIFEIIVILSFVFLINIIGIYLYKIAAVKFDIVANPNFRALHQKSIPRGGGVIFAVVFSCSIFLLWIFNFIPFKLFTIFGIGGFFVTSFGFVDDVIDITALKKLFTQLFISTITFFCLYEDIVKVFDWLPVIFVFIFVIIFLVWMINAYNFIDGIDGMAATGAIFISGASALIILLTNGAFEIIIISLLLMTCVGAFIIFNWPPASIFMGDSGSIFLGYFFGVLILYTTFTGSISYWTWIIIFGYYIADTSLTLIIRLIIVKKWYRAHRSHAYQNLARISNNHLKVTMGVLIYNLIWLLPLALMSVKFPNVAIIFTLVAIIPAVMVSYKFGPLLSSS
jgi:Fuc2NAc and GlcNAc transferase